MALTVGFLVTSAAICCGLIKMVMWHLGRLRLYKLASKFPGPPVLPLIGNANIFAGSSEGILKNFDELGKSYPSPFRIWMAPRLLIFVTDPEQVKVICLSPKTLGKTPLFINFCKPFLGTGLFTASVPKWKLRRKLIQPTFNPKILDSFVEVFASQAKILTGFMERHLDGPEFELFNLVSACTLDMICETAMGVKIGAQENRSFSYVEAVQGVVTSLGKRFFHFWLEPDFIFYRTQSGRDQQKHVQFLHRFTDDVIRKKKQELLERSCGRPDEADACESTPKKKLAFLDHLLKLSNDKGDFSDQAIRPEVDTMVFAGNESSAITDCFVMLMLASHPDVQEKVYRELYEIFGDADIEERPATAKDLPQMKYLECVIKETLRLFPVAPMIIREVTEDLNMGDHTLPKDSVAVLGILPLHRNDKYWPDPLKFDPDRFLPKEIAKRHPYSFMAFSGGPRNCIGLNYAMMAMKTMIATVLRRYVLKKDDILPVKDIRLETGMLLKTVDPIKLRIEKRRRNL